MSYVALAAQTGSTLQGITASFGVGSPTQGNSLAGLGLGGIGDPQASTTRRIANLLFDPAGIFGGIGPGSGDEDDVSSPEFGDLIKLFPSVKKADNLVRELYGPEGRGLIEDFLFAPPSALEKRERNFFRNELPGLIDTTAGNLESLFPTTRDIVETGLRTDIDPIRQFEERRLRETTLPEIAARFGGALSGSGFEQATSFAAGDVASRLGALQTQLDEAAAGRRTGFVQSGAPERIFTAPTDLRTGAAIASGAAGERWRSRQPGARLAQFFPTAIGAATSQGFLQPGFNPAGSGNVLNALGSAAPSIVEGVAALSNLFGNSGGGGGGGVPATNNLGTNPEAFQFNTSSPTLTNTTVDTAGFSEFGSLFGAGGSVA